MQFRVVIGFLLVFISYLQAAQVIIIMGPSCAGKSTLGKFTCAQLNSQYEEWRVVDFDDVEENIEHLIVAVNECLQNNINVIVDTNTYDSEMEKNIKGAVTITKIIVTAPLDVLLARDEIRTQRLQRSAARVERCRDFVIHSFYRSLTWPSDLIINASQQSVQQSYAMIVDFLKKS